MQLNKNLEVQALIDVLSEGDEAIYNLRNFDNKITAIKDLSYWEGEIRALERCNNIKVLDTILSCKSLEAIMYMRSLVMDCKEYTPWHIAFLNKAFVVAIYKLNCRKKL